jgi:hypothetical protein
LLNAGYDRNQDPFEQAVFEHLKMNGIYWGVTVMLFTPLQVPLAMIAMSRRQCFYLEEKMKWINRASLNLLNRAIMKIVEV